MKKIILLGINVLLACGIIENVRKIVFSNESSYFYAGMSVLFAITIIVNFRRIQETT